MVFNVVPTINRVTEYKVFESVDNNTVINWSRLHNGIRIWLLERALIRLQPVMDWILTPRSMTRLSLHLLSQLLFQPKIFFSFRMEHIKSLVWKPINFALMSPI